MASGSHGRLSILIYYFCRKEFEMGSSGLSRKGYKYKRILLKLSGEAVRGKDSIIDFDLLDAICKKHNGLWSGEAEKYLLANAKEI